MEIYKKKILTYICMTILIFSIVLSLISILPLNSIYDRKFLDFIFLFVYIYAIIVIYNITGTYKDLNIIFLFFFMFFLGTRIIFDIFSDKYDITYFDFFFNLNVPNRTLCITIANLIIAILGYLLGFLLFNYKRSIRNNNFVVQINLDGLKNKIIYTILFIGIVFKINYAYQMFSVVEQQGYLAIFLGDLDIDRTFINLFFESFFEIGLFLFITKGGAKKISLLLILFYSLLLLSTGKRGISYLAFTTFIFYMYKLKMITLNLKWILPTILIFIFLAIFISYWRIDSFQNNNTSILDTLETFLYSQSMSISVLMSTVQNIDGLDYSIWDLFSGVYELIDYYWIKFTNADVLQDRLSMLALKYKSFSSYISYISDQAMYYRGYGLGGSYVAQFYAVGGETFQFLGGIITSFIMNIMYIGLYNKNILYRFYAFHALSTFLYIPRDNLFDFLTENWIGYFCFYLLYIIFLKNRSVFNR